MKLLINEKQEKTLYKYILQEYSGYVNGFEKTIEYIYKSVYQTVQNIENKDKQYIDKLLTKFEADDNIDNYIKPIIIDENNLIKLGIKNVKMLIVHYFVSNTNNGGGFNKNGTTIENNKFDKIEIYLNVGNIIQNKLNGLKETLQHELTHAYQLLRMYRSKGEHETDDNFNNKYYTSNIEKNNLPQIFSYAFSKVELNAYISELYTTLKNNNANKNNYKEIVQNSKIYDMYNLLITITKALNGQNKIKQTTQIMKWIDENPTHVDMFPSKNGMTTERYNKRLVAMCNDKLQYILNKINKISERYLMDKQKESN